MPPLTRWFVRTALIYFVAGTLLGVVLSLRGVLRLPAFLAGLDPGYVHLLTVGWITQLIAGVAHWLFPLRPGPAPRGNESLGWSVYGCLNAGLLLRLVGEPLAAARPTVAAATLIAVAAALQWWAGVGLALHLWPRVREK